MLKVLVISDIHAYSKKQPKGREPSYVNYVSPTTDPSKNPVQGLRHLIHIRQVAVPDLVLCGGDLGHQADPNAIEQVWTSLQSLKAEFQISELVSTTGNHDVDSRYKENKFDPRGFLKQLEPSFPFSRLDESGRSFLEYWANHFVIRSSDKYRLLIIDSTAFHGGGDTSTPEFVHGRISEYTIALIKERLNAELAQMASPPKINICLVHHHMQDDANEATADVSVMKGGQLLVKLLSNPRYGNWVIVHGHRHRSMLYWGGTDTSGPLILSAGAFGATREYDYDNPSPNQFHMLNFELAPPADLSPLLVGTMESWTWSPPIGWVQATSGAGLPGHAGFGFREQIPTLAAKVAALVDDIPQRWAHLTGRMPQLRYLIPADLQALLENLREFYGLHTELSINGLPFELARREGGHRGV